MKNIFLVIMLLLSGYHFTFAQYDMQALPPLNPDIKQGKLPNGLTYYVCKNTVPVGQASFYIISNVGALMENDEQNGLAHFWEAVI